MPVSFLATEERECFGRYQGAPTPEDLARYFHLDDTDQARIAEKRGDHNRLGFALQLGTVRYFGAFLDEEMAVPLPVVRAVAAQLGIDAATGIKAYGAGRQRLLHATEIRVAYDYVEIGEPRVGFRLTRWLYVLCWTGTDRPGALFERARAWLVTHKVLLPSFSTLERYIAKLRSRVEERLWRSLVKSIETGQAARLEALLAVPSGERNSLLDQLRKGPVLVSAASLVQSLQRLRAVRDLGVRLPATRRIPDSRIAALARYASSAKASAIQRMPELRRLATLVAFAHCLEATAQDDALEVLEVLLHGLFKEAILADKKLRQRTLKNLGPSGGNPGQRLPDRTQRNAGRRRTACQAFRESAARDLGHGR